MIFRTDIATAIGEYRVVPLGSLGTIELNTNSRVQLRLGEKFDQVRLTRGEFVISLDASAARPILASAGTVSALACKATFCLRLHHPRMSEIHVLSGEMELMTASESGLVVRMEKIKTGHVATIVSHRIRIRSVCAKEQSRAVSWRGGMIAANGQVLADVVADFNRYHRKQILLESPDIARFRIWGTFPAHDSRGFVSYLGNFHGLKARRVRKGLLLTTATEAPGIRRPVRHWQRTTQ